MVIKTAPLTTCSRTSPAGGCRSTSSASSAGTPTQESSPARSTTRLRTCWPRLRAPSRRRLGLWGRTRTAPGLASPSSTCSPSSPLQSKIFPPKRLVATNPPSKTQSCQLPSIWELHQIPRQRSPNSKVTIQPSKEAIFLHFPAAGSLQTKSNRHFFKPSLPRKTPLWPAPVV